MVRVCHFLLFINKAALDAEEPGKKTARSSDELPKGYALSYLQRKAVKPTPRVKEVLSKNGILLVEKCKVTPPADAVFEAFELTISTNRGAVFFHCADINFELVRQLFKRFSYFNSRISSGETIVGDSVNLFEKLLKNRVDMPFLDCKKDRTLLHFAVERRYKALLDLLIKLGADVNRVDSDGITPLHLAVDKNYSTKDRLLVVQKLFEQGVDVNAKSKQGLSPLHSAIRAGHIKVIRLILEKGANVNVKTKDGATPLHIASEILNKKDKSVVKLLLQHGANVHTTDSKGATPLVYFHRSPDVLKLLVEKGAKIDAKTKYGRTVLLEAMESKSFESAEFILTLRPSIKVNGNKEAFSVALGGFSKEHFQLFHTMLEQGFTVNPKTMKKPNMLLGAIDKGNVELVQQFLDNGIEVNNWYWHNNCSMTSLHFAIKNNQIAVVRLLLDRGADINAYRDNQGRLVNTPLVSAIRKGSIEIVEMLFKAKTRDRTDPKLLFHAMGNQLDVLKFLLEKGFDPNYKDEKGNSWPSYISNEFSPDTLEILTKFGAVCRYSDFRRITLTWKGKVLQAFLDHFPVDATVTVIADTLKYLYQPEIGYRHLVKMEVLKPELNVLDSIKRWSNGLNLGDFQERCTVEAGRLTENIGDSDVKYLDILSGGDHHTARYARNPSIVAAMDPAVIKSSFPIYSSILKCKFQMGVHRRSLMDAAIPVIGALFTHSFDSQPMGQPGLPDEISKMVCRFLSIRDLIILPKCLSTKQRALLFSG